MGGSAVWAGGTPLSCSQTSSFRLQVWLPEIYTRLHLLDSLFALAIR